MSTLAGRIASANAARLGTAATTARQAADYIVESRNEEKNKGGILGGIGYTVEKLGLGILSSVEGIWDFVAGGIAKLLGADEWAEHEMSTDLVDYNHADEWYNPSDAMKVVGDVAGGIGTSLPAIGSVIIAGGISGGTLTPLAAGLVSGATAGLGAAGRATKEAYDQTGQLGGKEFGYGALSGITEAGVEGVSSLVGMGSGQVVKGLAKSFGKQIATGAARETLGKSLIKGFVGEAFEEGLSELITPVWQRLTYDPNAKNATAQEVGYAALIGGLSGAIMGGADVSIRNSAGLVRGHRLVTEGKSDAVIQTAENLSAYEEENQTGFEAFESVKGALEELKTSMEKTGGQITTPRQKMLLGTLERANTCAAFTPFVMASAENIATNADSMVQRLSAYTDEKGQTFSYTAEQLREGLDFSSPKALRRSFAKALKKNQALRTLAVADATGRLLLDTNAYAQGMLNGQTPVSAVRWNEFIERASDREKQAIAQEFGIENLDAVTVEEVQSKMQAYFDNGGAERIRSDNALKKTLAALPEEKAKKRISADGIKEGTTRYRIGNDDFAVVKKDEQYRIYDYESGMLSKTLTKDEFGKVVEQLNNAAEKSNTAPKNDTQTDGSLGKPIKIRYALMNEKSFADNVKEILSMSDAMAIRNKNLGNYISVMKGTPAVITENVAGAENLEIIIRFDSLYLAARESGALQGNYHALGEEVASNLPQYISNPDAIVRLDNGRINLFTQIETKSGKNGIVSVELGTVKDINSRFEKYNLVISAFGAKDNYVKNIIKRDGTSVEYMKKDLSQVNPQLYEWLSIVNERSNTIISENSEMSTGKEKISEEVRKSSAKELDAYARENIEGYNKIGAANQRMIRSIIRQGRANGIAETDILSYARVATHTGVNIVFNKGLCAIAKEDTGEIIYSDGYNDEQNNRFVVNPESKRTAESLLIHEFSHTLFRTKGGRALLKLALKNMSVEDQKEIVARYRAAGRTNPVELLDEISAHYAEGILSSEKMLDRLLADKPNARKSFLAFFKRAKTEYSSDKQLSREALRLYKRYKKWFDKFSAANAYSNAREIQGINTAAGQQDSGDGAYLNKTGIDFALPIKNYPYDTQNVIQEYINSVDRTIQEHAEMYRSNKESRFVRDKICDVTEPMAAAIKSEVGVDVLGATININKNGYNHIEERHGEHGVHDNSMADVRDVARIGYVLQHYDSIGALKNKNNKQMYSKAYKNADNKPAPLVVISKKIDGTYYCGVAAVDSTYKKLWVETAYINKKGLTYALDALQTPSSQSSETIHSSRPSTNSILQDSEMSTDSSEKNKNKRYALAGENSATADGSMLSKAREMQTEGYDSEEIRQETGWFVGLDGKWRYEVDDSVMKPIEGAKFERHTSELGDYRTAKLGEVIRHDKLFEAYPQLKDITLIVQETSVANQGSAFLRDNQIVLNEDLFKRPSEEYQRFEESKKAEIEQIEQTREFKDYNRFYEDASLQERLTADEWLEQEKEAQDKFFSSDLGKRYHELMWGKSPVQKTKFGWTDRAKTALIHEIQHFIQSYEGFSGGTSDTYWANRLNKQYRNAYESARDGFLEVLPKLPTEARNAVKDLQERMFDDRYSFNDIYKDSEKIADLIGNEKHEQLWREYIWAYGGLYNFQHGAGNEAYNRYWNTAGEVEARDVESRIGLSAEERKAKRPDIDGRQVYFTEDGGKSTSRYALSPDGKRAVMTTERIDDIIRSSSAGNRADYARTWITAISPTDFINMTVRAEHQNRAFFDEKIRGDFDSTMSEYDYEKALKEAEAPYLQVRLETGEIIGHNGRHRMRMLEQQGVQSAEIAVEFFDSDGYWVKTMNGEGNALKAISSKRIKNQWGTGQTVTLKNIIPLNRAFRETVLDTYGEETAVSSDIRYALPNTKESRRIKPIAGQMDIFRDIIGAQTDTQQRAWDSDYSKQASTNAEDIIKLLKERGYENAVSGADNGSGRGLGSDGRNGKGSRVYDFGAIRRIFEAQGTRTQEESKLYSKIVKELGGYSLKSPTLTSAYQIGVIDEAFYTYDMLRIADVNAKNGVGTVFYLDQEFYKRGKKQTNMLGCYIVGGNNVYISSLLSTHGSRIPFESKRVSPWSGKTTYEFEVLQAWGEGARYAATRDQDESIRNVMRHERLHLMYNAAAQNPSKFGEKANAAAIELKRFVESRFAGRVDDLHRAVKDYYVKELGYGKVETAIEEIACDLYSGSLVLNENTDAAEIQRLVDAIDNSLTDIKGADGVRYALPSTDSEGKVLSEQQRRYFKDSKVVDKDGRLQVVYHATNAIFTQVDFKKGSQGLFWFTSSKENFENGNTHAAGVRDSSHVRVMELYADIKKPAGWEEYNTYGIDELQHMGYDGAILDKGDGTFDGFVFKSANQVKSVDNKTPTKAKDIRYALSENGKGKEAYSYDTLTKKDDLQIVSLPETIPTNEDGSINRKAVIARGRLNARKQNNAKNTDTRIYVAVADIGKDVLLGREGLEHGIARSKETMLAVMKMGDILRSSIAVNELNGSMSRKTDMSYVLLGVCQDDSNLYLVRSIVSKQSSDVISLDVYKLGAVKSKKVKTPNRAQVAAAVAEQSPLISSESYTISIADLLESVKEIPLANEIFSADVAQKLGITRSAGSLSSDIRYALPKDKITVGMTDDERYQALKDRTITLVAADNTKLESAKKKLQGLEEEINFSSLNRQSKLRLLRKLGEEFGVYKTYGNADISLSFEYSKKNLKESVHKQGRNYDSFAKMLTCFDGVVENAVGIEMHNRNAEGYKPDPTLKNVYVLASAFEDGDRITPVKLEVKEFSDKENTLYVAVALESIKTDRIVPTGSSTEGGVAQISPLPVTISISELLRNVNPSDKNFYKYIPKKFFDGENGGIRYALPDPDKGASAVEQAQVYANNARMRVYSVKDSAETVQRALEMLNMDSGWKYISLKGKSRAQVIRSLTVAFNKAEPNERATLAAEFADYIIDSAIVENLYEGDMEMEARNVLELLRPYLHAFDLHGIQGEIRHRYDKRNNINLMWGQKKGGVAPDVVAQELAQYGFHIEAENEAEIFFEIVDRYEEARRTLRDVVKKERAADYVTPEQRDEIIADILHDFETGGEETRHARLLKYYKNRIDALSKKLREARIRNNYTNQIVDGVSKLRSYLKREYEPSSVWQAPELRAWVKQASRLSTRTDLRKRGVRKLFADLRAFYNTSNPLLYSEDAMLSHYDQNVADALELLASNAESNKPLTIEELRAASVVVASLNHLYRTYDTILVRGRQTSLTEYAKRGVASLKRNVYSHVGKGILNTGYDFKNLVVDARSVFRNLDGYAESVLTELYQDLCDAETTQSLTEIELRRDLDAYLKKNRKYKRRLQHDHVQIGDATLTIDQAISLYELSKREQAQEGLKQAGYSYVDEKNVKHTATFTGIDEKIFTKEDWEFIALVEQFFNVKSSETKRRADMNIMGYTNVQDAFYFPIARDDGTIARNVTDPGSASRDIASVYNFSFNKDVKKGARSKLFVEAVTSIVGRHAQQLAQYSALTLPLKNFAQVYAKNVGTVTNVESLKTILNEKIWDKTDGYLRKFFDDMQGKGRRAPTLLRRVRSAYAKYQLGFNLKVFLSQITSYPTAGVVLDFDVLVRAFTMKSKKGFFAELDRYCPYARARAYQRGIVRAEGLVDHIGKIGDALTKPIQWTDRLTIGMLWKASQLQVLKNDGYELGTEANLQAAGKLLEKVIRETQPNYTTTERSALMRSDSDILASFTMFTSVPLKQLSRLVDAVGEWRTLSRKARFGTATDAELARLKASRKKLGRVIAAVTVANICYVLVGQAIKSLYAKDRKDKDGNEIPVWEDILLDFSATTIGMLPFAKDIYGYFVNDYDFNNFAFDTVDNLLGASQELFGLVTDAAQGKPVEQTQYMRALRSSLYSIGQMTGIPVRNLNNTVVGLVRRFSSANGYRYDSLFYTDSYAADLKQALEKGDEKLADAIMDLAVGKNGAGELSAAGRKKLIDLYRAGYSVLPRSIGEKITVNGEQKEVSAAEQKRIFSAYSAASARVDALIVSPVFEKLSEEDQAKAIKNIFDASYDEAIGNASGARLLMFEKTNAFADIIAAICGAKAVEGQKDKEGKTIAGSKKQAVIQYLNSLNLTRAQCILVLRYLGYTLSNGEFCNMSAAQVNITLLNYLRSCGFSNEERAYFSTAA